MAVGRPVLRPAGQAGGAAGHGQQNGDNELHAVFILFGQIHQQAQINTKKPAVEVQLAGFCCQLAAATAL